MSGHRSLDAAEACQMVHLYRTRQERPDALAARFEVSKRTLFRYHRAWPSWGALSPSAYRLRLEAERIGIALSRADAERLAAAALDTGVGQ